MKLSDYGAFYLGNDTIDAASLESYTALVKSLNDLIAKAADEKLKVDDEPADFERRILRSGS